jgi:hypothetical protein
VGYAEVGMGKGYYEAHIPIPYLEFIWDMLHVGSTWYRSSSIPTFVGDASWLVVVRSCRWVVDEELRATSGERGSTQHRLTWMEDDLSWRFGVVIRRALPNSLIYALCFPKKNLFICTSQKPYSLPHDAGSRGQWFWDLLS